MASLLASIGADGNLMFWDVYSMIAHQSNKRNTGVGSFLRRNIVPRRDPKVPQICHCAEFAPDGQVLFVGDRNATVHLFSGFSAVFLCKEAGVTEDAAGNAKAEEDDAVASDSEEEGEDRIKRK